MVLARDFTKKYHKKDFKQNTIECIYLLLFPNVQFIMGEDAENDGVYLVLVKEYL